MPITRAKGDGCSIVLHQTNDGHHHWLCPNCKRENISRVGVIDLNKFLPSVICSECGFEFGVDKSALPTTETKQPDLITEVEELLAKATPGPWSNGSLTNDHPAVFGSDGSVAIAEIIGFPLRREAQAQANGSLIAATPDLLRRLAEEVKTLRSRPERGSACIVCSAELLMETSEPPRCLYCYVTDEDRERWEAQP